MCRIYIYIYIYYVYPCTHTRTAHRLTVQYTHEIAIGRYELVEGALAEIFIFAMKHTDLDNIFANRHGSRQLDTP